MASAFFKKFFSGWSKISHCSYKTLVEIQKGVNGSKEEYRFNGFVRSVSDSSFELDYTYIEQYESSTRCCHGIMELTYKDFICKNFTCTDGYGDNFTPTPDQIFNAIEQSHGDLKLCIKPPQPTIKSAMKK